MTKQFVDFIVGFVRKHGDVVDIDRLEGLLKEGHLTASDSQPIVEGLQDVEFSHLPMGDAEFRDLVEKNSTFVGDVIAKELKAKEPMFPVKLPA